MEIKMVFCDIDGTLLNPDHKLPQENVDTIRRVIDKGISFVLTSGRTAIQFIGLYDHLALDTPMICCNGASVYQVEAGSIRQVMCWGIDSEIVLSLYDRIKPWRSDITFTVYSDGKWLVPERNEIIKVQIASCQMVEPQVCDIKEWLLRDVQIEKIMLIGKDTAIKEVNDIIINDFQSLNCCYSDSVTLEISRKGITKLQGIKKVLELYDISEAEAMAVGDGPNDIEMLNYVGVGIAMGNAPDVVKQAANAVTLSNKTNGLSDALRLYCLTEDL